MNEDDIRKYARNLGKKSWEKRVEKYGEEGAKKKWAEYGKLGGRPKKKVEKSEESGTIDE